MHSKRSISEQLQRYYDQTNILYNIEDIVKAQTAEYNNTLREVSREQAEIIKEGTSAICGTLEDGFALITEELHGVENSIYQMTDTLCTHLKMMIDEQRYNNILSENIALLLKIPDSQKERQVNIQKGLKFFNDALRDPSFFEYSLKFLDKAIKDDDTDYFVLDKIGLLYLCSKQHKNYDEAIKYFTKAVKFSKVDTHPSSIRLANILAGDISKPLQNQHATVNHIKYLTGQSLLWISIAYYEQGKFSEAIRFAQEAFQIAPTLLDAEFHLAKSLAANNENEKAAEVLYSLIQKNSNYSIKTLTDRDLAPKAEIKDTLEILKQEAFNEASTRTNKCKSLILPYSNGKNMLNRIEHLTNHKSFLSCKKAIDLLNKKNSYTFNEAIWKNDLNKWESFIKPLTFEFSLEELIDYENTLAKYLSIVKNLISMKENKAVLISEIRIVKSNYDSSNKELTENNKEASISGFVLLGCVLGLFLGISLMSNNWKGNGSDMSFGSWFLGVIGLVLLLGGLVGGFIGTIYFITVILKNISITNKTEKLSAKEQELENNIRELETEIQQLESS